MTEKKDGMARRSFVQGSAVASAFAFLGGSLPIFGETKTPGNAGQVDASKAQFTIDEHTQLPDGEEATASASFPDPNGSTITLRQFVRTIETDTNRTIISHMVLTSPSGKTSPHMSIISVAKGTVENGFQNITTSSVNIGPDGTITRQSPRNSRVPLTNPYEGMSPLQMFQQMIKDRQSGKPPLAQVQP